MISKISFGSTYKVNNQNPDAFAKFRNYAHHMYAFNIEMGNGISIGIQDRFIKKSPIKSFDYVAEQTLIVPDNMDAKVEKFCEKNGIIYKKYNTKDLLNPQNILSRISPAPSGYRKVTVNSEKLEELIQNQDSNLQHVKNDFEKYYIKRVDEMLKNSAPIPATTMVINYHSGNKELERYVDKFGEYALNDKQLYIGFNQKTDSPDHCLYFALRDMGINKIPMYVDNESYEAGQILGLFQ